MRSVPPPFGMRASLAFVSFFLGLSSLSPAAGGWVGKSPPNILTPDSGRRSHVFYTGDPVKFQLPGKGLDRFEVRDYWGDVVDQGPADGSITINVKNPGWYKLYVTKHNQPPPKPKGDLDLLIEDSAKKPAASTFTDKDRQALPVKQEPNWEQIWGNIAGTTTFVIFRRDERFPELPHKDAFPGGGGTTDQVLRGVIVMGPQRHSVSADKPEESIKNLSVDISIDRALYLPFDPVRPRSLMAAFGGGTKNTEGVRRLVEHFKSDITYWEPRNEPNFGSTGAKFVENELKPFHETVKAVDPKLKVLGPGTVTIGPGSSGLLWIEDFLKAGGAQYLDAFSFHAYNCVNGDFWLARKAMDSLAALLKKYNIENIEKWQTEQGFFACVYGSYQPRLQGRWTMVEMMVFEQYGLPKEHNHLWYDRSHGFWNFPTWWENNDGGLNPAAPLMRVWAEELFGLKFARAYDFGSPGNQLYIGSHFTGADREIAAFMSAGSTDGRVELKVNNGTKLKIVSAFGVESEIPVQNGTAILPVPELPVYVKPAKGQSIEVVPTNWGPNLARRNGVTATSSGLPAHPVKAEIDNNISKIINGELENWYWTQKNEDQPWLSNVDTFPAWIDIQLPEPQQITRAVIYAAPPWQWQSSLLDYELQYEDGGKWVTLERVVEAPKTFRIYSPPTRTSVDSFYSDRWVFQHHLTKPVTTSKIRILVHECTWGGGATKDVTEAGGQTGPHQIMLREIELYGK